MNDIVSVRRRPLATSYLDNGYVGYTPFTSMTVPESPESVLAREDPKRAERVLIAQSNAGIVKTWLTHRLPDEKDIDVRNMTIGPFSRTRVSIR